jgi:hypothetical protein
VGGETSRSTAERGPCSSLTSKHPTANGHVEVGTVGGESSRSTFRTGRLFQPDQEAPDSKWSRRGRCRGWRDQQEHVEQGAHSSLTRKHPTANGHVDVGTVGGETSRSIAERGVCSSLTRKEGSTRQQMVTSRSVPWVARPAGALPNRAHVPA